MPAAGHGGNGRVRVLIVDDDDDMRFLLRAVTDSIDEIEVIGEAETGDQGVELWREHRPDVIVLDSRMPGANGAATAARILAEDPDQEIILFSASASGDEIDAAHAAGVRHVVRKDELRRLAELLTSPDGSPDAARKS